jgi:excisionase family DNA binding protein
MRLLSSEEAQEKLGISRPTLYLWVRQGKLKPQRAGRGLRFVEDEVLGLLGQGPQIAAWIRRTRIEEARRDVRRSVRAHARPTLVLEYQSPPSPDFLRVRVVSAGDAGLKGPPAPGGALFESLLDSMTRRDYVFISHENSVWEIHDVRAETSPAGDPYIAMELRRPSGPGEGDDRGRRLRDFVAAMRSGIYTGRVTAWRRDDLHERGSG